MNARLAGIRTSCNPDTAFRNLQSKMHPDPANPSVFLVGAGPGSPGLLTVRAAEVLARADLVLYDQLVPERLLDLAPAAARKVCVRDLPGQHPDKYPHIHNLLIEAARAGQDGRAAQGRRPAHLRPRRRGGRGAARRRGRRTRSSPA